MKLDSRIIDGKKPLTCFDTEEAKQFIGQEGYFSNKKVYFKDLNDTCRDVLQDMFDSYDNTPPFKDSNDFCQNLNETYCFVSSVSGYKYFLPAEWLKEPKTKYRPFTLAEWIERHEIGEEIHYRSKSEGIELRHIYTGYAFNKGKDITKPNVGTLTLGVASYSFDYLLEDYEIEINNEWLPFGVEGED